MQPHATPCSVEGCSEPVHGHGWCNTHYRRWKRRGSPEPAPRTRPLCAVTDCERVIKSRGWCSLHYDRWRSTGDPAGRRRPPAAGKPCIDCAAVLITGRSWRGRCQQCANRAYRMVHRERLRAHKAADYRAHRGERQAKQRRYNADHREKRRAYYATHRLKLREQSRQYHAANRAKLAKRREADRDRQAIREARWRKANPDKVRELNHRRHARRRNAFVSTVQFEAIWQRDRGVCQICMWPVEHGTASLDHILPLAQGGTHEPRNVRLAHRRCNSARRDRGAAQLRLLD